MLISGDSKEVAFKITCMFGAYLAFQSLKNKTITILNDSPIRSFKGRFGVHNFERV